MESERIGHVGHRAVEHGEHPSWSGYETGFLDADVSVAS
jgi:hypothetical protein